MVLTLKDITEAKSYEVKLGRFNQKSTVNRSNMVDYIDGQEVYLSSIKVKTAVDKIEISIVGNGAWEQIKEKYEVVGWKFKPSKGTKSAPITIRLVKG